MVSAKGKEKVADGGGKGKRKWSSSGGDDKTGHSKSKNGGVIQFFDDVAYQVDEDEYSSDDSLFDTNDFLVDELSSELILSSETEKVPLLLNGEDQMSEEELERILEERYKPGAGYVTYAEDGCNYEHKSSIETDYVHVPSAIDPIIWKVKCMVGRERYSAFCLMQKYVDLEYLGTKLQIISAFAPDHAKGFILIEAEKQHHIYEACKGLHTIYSSRVTLVPNKEISRLLSIRSKSSSAITEGMWARVKNGKYKGDLALVLAVNDARKKVTVKLIPRIDLKAMAEKFGGGVAAKRTSIPPQRLISFSELDEFRSLIHCRRDRDTKEIVEVLDGMMLKDGYLYKKISIDSLSFWGVMPTDDELSKFEPSEKVDFTDAQWLSDLFGEKKETQLAIFEPDRRSRNVFEMHDLVFFGRDFGVVISSEKDDDTVKVIRESSEGPLVVTVKKSELKIASFDKKLFSVSDHNSRTISINDSVRVLHGPLKDRQGVVKKIYKGILFLFDESEEDNNGYICITARLCEKVNISGETSHEKVEGSEPAGPSEFADLPSPLINKTNFKSEDNEIFSVGQSLRIRVGPLKGYLCRVLAIRRSYVTVKLDSQQKIITVKVEHLSEVRGRDSAISQGYITPFDGASGKEEDSSWQIKETSDHQISSWGKIAFEPNPIDDGSWGRAVEKWTDQKTIKSLNKPKLVGADECGSSWNKPDGGFSFWSGEQPEVGKSSKDQYDEDQGFGGWKKGGMRSNRDEYYSYQEGSWGRSKAFEGGRGSGGRRGRGGGRGRSFDQGRPSTNWNKCRDQDATWSSKTTNWNRGQDSDNRGKRGGRRGGDPGGFRGRGGSGKEGGFRGRGTGFRGRGGRGKGGW